MVMAFFITKASFQNSCSGNIESFSEHSRLLYMLYFLFAFGNKIGGNVILPGILPIGVGSINLITGLMSTFAKKNTLQMDTALPAGPFIKSIIAKMLYKVDPIYLQHVHFGSKFHCLCFFASYYRPDIRFI